ncbi:hypothetical protein L6164_002952 [Bauhinia variegata]|uniref:Uncharacterized protein n=1 Tax=Bauhinia variegata TaxID=167791 RepID=A0ACB9PZQ0_BAUVA|nr:hypothetical protein L6164_002952 [Bauhinia variegata]
MPCCCSCFSLKKCTHSRSASPRPISSPQTDLTEFHSSPLFADQATDNRFHSLSSSRKGTTSSPQTDLTEFHYSPLFADQATDNRFHSLSTSRKGTTSYDVFISCFDGYEDNRVGFFYHLVFSLQSAGLAVYRDVQGHRKWLLIANRLSSSLLKDIERSRVCIVIFSSAFARSKCCLEEVEKIMEFHTTIGQIVLPVFYNVEQREVSRQRGIFGESFAQLLMEISATKDKELSWRSALTKAANLKGWHSTDPLR